MFGCVWLCVCVAVCVWLCVWLCVCVCVCVCSLHVVGHSPRTMPPARNTYSNSCTRRVRNCTRSA